MQKRRFNLPPLDLIQGFEAAARNLSFTKAAEELFITQSAVSRQIRALEEHLSVPLFERRHRALVLTEQGRILQRAATELLERLQEVTDRMRTAGVTRQLTVTTTNGFASLWLIPRLRGFTGLQPDVDVRISATYKTINLERSLVDVAVRLARPRTRRRAPRGCSERSCFPSAARPCSTRGRTPLRTLQDLEHHALLHMHGAEGLLDWGTWLAAQGCVDLKPAASLRFDGYEQMIGAALSGQGVAMGIGRLVSGLLAGGPAGGAVLQEPRRRARLLRHLLVADGHAAARAGVRRLADRRGQDRRRCAGPRPCSAPHHQRRSQPAQGREHAQRGDAPGARVVRVRDVLDGHGQVGGIRRDA